MIEFVVEDGTGLDNATSYVSIDEFKQYAENNGYDITALDTDASIQVLLNKSTFVIDSTYMSVFPGYRGSSEQTLEFPRVDAFYIDGYAIKSDEVPKEIKNAVCEMAFLKFNGIDLQPVLEKSGSLRSEMVQVDVIKEAKEYFSGTDYDRDVLLVVEDALARITGGVSALYKLNIIRVGG